MFSENDLNQYYRYALSLTGDEASAYDLVQGSVENLIRARRENNRTIKNLKSYVMTMIRNKYIDQFRRSSKFKEEPISEADGIVELRAPSFEDIYSSEELAKGILNQLEDSDRELLFLSAVEEYSITEISEMTAIPRGTILSRLHRLKKKIKDEILAKERAI